MGLFIGMSGMPSPIMSKAIRELAQKVDIGSISALCLRIMENVSAMVGKDFETSLLRLKPFFASHIFETP